MRLFFLIVLVFFSFNFVIAQANLKKADKYFELYQFDKAIDAYSKVLEKNPEEINAYFQIAECYYLQNQLSNAIEWYEKKINESDVKWEYIYHYAQALRSNGSLDEAKIWFKILSSKDSIIGSHFYNVCERIQTIRLQAPTQEVKNEFINSESKDFASAFYKNALVYGSGRLDISFPGKKNKVPGDGKVLNRLLTSSQDQNGYLKPPSLFHSLLQDQSNDMPLSFSSDNKWVTFTKGSFQSTERPFSGKGKEHSLYIAKVNEQGNWIDIKSLPFNISGYSDTWPFLAENGQKLYFSSNRPGGNGGYDIYVSQKFGDKWSEPANVGNMVNTPGDEISPYVLGNKLYFSSDWHSGLGGFDVCVSTKDDGRWIDPQSLNTGINSTFDDYGFCWSTERNIGYFTSNRQGGKGSDDIYRVRNIGAPFTLIVESSTGGLIPMAIIDANNCGLGMLNSNEEGKAFFKTLPKEKCSCTVSFDGYETQKLDINRDEVLGSQTRKIVLKARIIEYTFKLINKSDGEPIPQVPVEISTQAGESVQKFSSDENGEVKLTLIKDKMYFFKTLSDNYISESKLVNTSSKSEEKVKLLIPLEPSEVLLLKKKNEVNKTFRSKGPFAVQIGTFKSNIAIDFAKYDKMLSDARAYTIEDDGQSLKLRIGNFSSKAEAQNAIRILNQNNVKNCFVVEDKNYKPIKIEQPIEEKETKLPVVSSKVIDSKPVVKNDKVLKEEVLKPSKVQETVEIKEIPKPEDNFRVRIAAVRDARFADDPLLAPLGVVLLEPAGEYTRVYLGYFQTQDQAKAALINAVKAGFKDAYVCKNVKNTWVKAK